MATHRQQTDAEVCLAQALAAQQHCLLVFSSPTCRLCNSLAPDIAAAQKKYSNSLQVAHINASNDILFAPEVCIVYHTICIGNVHHAITHWIQRHRCYVLMFNECHASSCLIPEVCQGGGVNRTTCALAITQGARYIEPTHQMDTGRCF